MGIRSIFLPSLDGTNPLWVEWVGHLFLLKRNKNLDFFFCVITLMINLDVARPDHISGADINAICQEVSLKELFLDCPWKRLLF